jgi:crotonobetainyl-CoA:carnitine CoA-transferase CaiB-like acyl-CoA transferase
MPDEPPAALAPYRVLDLTGEIGQYCGRAFAEMGATVIKVEPPEGDLLRRVGPFFHDEPRLDHGLLWFVLNASKKGVTCNLEQPDGRSLFRRLVAKADVVLESYPPGYLEGLGLDYAELRKDYPRLVWVSITGFGQDGPYKDYKWSDLIGLALGGLLYLFGDQHRPPTRARASQAYYHASLAGALGGMIALYHARRTGAGQYLDVSMQEAVTVTLAGPGGISGYWPLQQLNITRSGPRVNLGEILYRIIFPCKDGYVATGGLFGPHTPRLVELMKQDNAAEFLEDPKWLTATRAAALPGMWRCSQGENDAAEEVLARWLLRYTRDEIIQMAQENDLLFLPVLTVAENLESEQLKARNYYQQVAHPELGTAITYPGPPLVLSATPWQIKGRAPLLGEHNVEVYGEIGLTKQDLEALTAIGAV